MTLRILLAVDMTDPVAARLFWEGFRLSDAERAAIQARAAASRQFDSIARQDGVQAAIKFAMNRSFKAQRNSFDDLAQRGDDLASEGASV